MNSARIDKDWWDDWYHPRWPYTIYHPQVHREDRTLPYTRNKRSESLRETFFYFFILNEGSNNESSRSEKSQWRFTFFFFLLACAASDIAERRRLHEKGAGAQLRVSRDWLYQKPNLRNSKNEPFQSWRTCPIWFRGWGIRKICCSKIIFTDKKIRCLERVRNAEITSRHCSTGLRPIYWRTGCITDSWYLTRRRLFLQQTHAILPAYQTGWLCWLLLVDFISRKSASLQENGMRNSVLRYSYCEDLFLPFIFLGDAVTMRPENPDCVDYKKKIEKIDRLQSERFLERWHRCKIPDCQAFQQLSQRYQLCSQLHTNRRGVANNFSSWVYIIVASTQFRCCNALWSNF